MTLLDFSENVVGDGLHSLGAVFDGEAVDILEDYFAAFDLVTQEVFEDPAGFDGDGRADAVAAQYADADGVDLGEVGPFLILLEALYAL